MKTLHMVLIGAGAVGVGYLLLKPRAASAMSGDYLPPVQVQETQSDLAAQAVAKMRSLFGAKATSGSSSGLQSVANAVLSANNAGASQVSNKVVPGSGPYAALVTGAVGKSVTIPTEKLASAGSSLVKKLKFW